MKLDLKDLDSLKPAEVTKLPYGPDQKLKAIIKVSRAGYVPSGVQLRSRIDDHLFTGEFMASKLPQIQSDSQVVSVEVSQNLNRIE